MRISSSVELAFAVIAVDDGARDRIRTVPSVGSLQPAESSNVRATSNEMEVVLADMNGYGPVTLLACQFHACGISSRSTDPESAFRIFSSRVFLVLG